MKNLIFVFVIIFVVFTSCKDDDGLDILVDGDDVVQVDDQDDSDDNDGVINTIHLELDEQDRIIKRVIREAGKDIAEFNFDYSVDVIKKQFGYTTRSNGVVLEFERFYKYDFESINPFSFDPYVAQLALGENVSPYMVSSMSTATGVYNLKQSISWMKMHYLSKDFTRHPLMVR